MECNEIGQFWQLADQHHRFYDLAAAHPWLVPLETAIRDIRPETAAELHALLDCVYVLSDRPPDAADQVAMCCHLGRVLDDQCDAGEVS